MRVVSHPISRKPGPISPDRTVFWRDDRLERIMPVLVKQIRIGPSMNLSDGDKRTLISCLSGFTHAVNSEELLKSTNLAILMETRSEESKVQLFALEGLTAVWKREGARTMGESPPTPVIRATY